MQTASQVAPKHCGAGAGSLSRTLGPELMATKQWLVEVALMTGRSTTTGEYTLMGNISSEDVVLGLVAYCESGISEA